MLSTPRLIIHQRLRRLARVRLHALHLQFQVPDLRARLAQLGAALLYFTGSKGHNIKLRQRALAREWTLNEYALSEIEGGKIVASETEEDIYRALGLAYIPPVLREDAGEIEAAETGTLPRPIGPLCGDFHLHTTVSGDGRSSLEEMVAAAIALLLRQPGRSRKAAAG